MAAKHRVRSGEPGCVFDVLYNLRFYKDLVKFEYL